MQLRAVSTQLRSGCLTQEVVAPGRSQQGPQKFISMSLTTTVATASSRLSGKSPRTRWAQQPRPDSVRQLPRPGCKHQATSPVDDRALIAACVSTCEWLAKQRPDTTHATNSRSLEQTMVLHCTHHRLSSGVQQDTLHCIR
jgi:hypothetical protein